MTRPRAAEWARAQLAAWDVDGPVDAALDVSGADRVRDWAESGAVALTGRAAGPPLVPPGAAATAALGAEAAFATLAGRDGTRSWHRLLGQRAALAGLRRNAPWSAGGSCRAVRTVDGWVAVSLARPDDVAAVPALVGDDVPVPEAAAAWRLLGAWAAAQTSAAVVERATLLAVPCGAVPPEGQWRSRAALTPGVASAPVCRQEVAPGPPLRGSPLVVDVSALWAGPLCARLLGAAGARVVKVEIAPRLDGARRGNRDFYAALHAGHESVLVDLARAADRELLHELVDRADVVIEASRPRALRALGLDAEEVCRRSATTWVSITGYGRTAPDRPGFGDDVAMAAGLAARDGDDRPVPCGDAIADPLTGMHAAVAALASVRTGGSRVLDIAMSDVAAATVAWAPEPARPSRLEGDRWVVDTERGPVPVGEPQADRPEAEAAEPGRDTERWRAS